MAHENSTTLSINVEGKNMVIAYVLWWFLGWAGIHRFYLGKTQSGMAQLLLFIVGWATSVIFIGFAFLAVLGIWWLLDAYFVQKYVSEYNEQAGISVSSLKVSTLKSETPAAERRSNLDELERLHALLEKGAITQEEYNAKKGALL
ncbi:MAG: NINE protein [Campylobacterales bacterium]|nr:NINE protein [Campylobacterales bacterium]